MSYEVRIENFEGPLDLLLHLIRKNEMDIYDIPMAEITAQYLATLEAMQTLNLDVAGEFLVMAATLLHIKSRMLLPQPEEEAEEEPEEDPRAELVRRLLEYQKYQEAGRVLDALPRLGREVFAAPGADPGAFEAEETMAYAEVGIYDLVEAFRELLQQAPEAAVHDIVLDQLSVTEKVNEILSRLGETPRLGFGELLERSSDRSQVVVTFLALLELVRLRVVRLVQESRGGPIWLLSAVSEEELDHFSLSEDALGYL